MTTVELRYLANQLEKYVCEYHAYHMPPEFGLVIDTIFATLQDQEEAHQARD